MLALCPEHPKRDQNPKFTPLSETTSIPVCFIYESPPPGRYYGKGKPSLFLFFAWTSRGFKISRHTSAQVASGLKTALRKNNKNLAADVCYPRSLSIETLFSAKIVSTANGHNRFKNPAFYSKCKLLFS